MKWKKAGISLIIILVMIINIGCSRKELKDLDYAKTVVLTVDNSSIYLNELMYHVILQEFQGQLYASFINDTDFWNKEYSKGVTMGDVMKQEAMDNAIKYEILYLSAVEDGYTLTEEETADCSSKSDSILKSLSEKDIKRMDLTKDEVLELQKKIALSARYYNDYYKSKNIDDETAYKEIKEGHKIVINQKVWKQIKFEEIKK